MTLPSDSEFDICFDLLDVLIISSGNTNMTHEHMPFVHNAKEAAVCDTLTV